MMKEIIRDNFSILFGSDGYFKLANFIQENNFKKILYNLPHITIISTRLSSSLKYQSSDLLFTVSENKNYVMIDYVLKLSIN